MENNDENDCGGAAGEDQEKVKSTTEGWRTWQVVMYAVTGLLGFVTSIVFYLVLERSDRRCYQYNAVLMVHERSRDEYKPRIAHRDVWYRIPYCYDSFTFSMHLSIFSTVAMALCLVFGRGGVETSDFDHTTYFSIVGQWHLVFWACLFNFWYMLRSLIVSLQFTDGYKKFLGTVLQLPADDSFRNEFENSVQPLYVSSMMLFWILTTICALNFVLMFYRCVMGVDFEAEFNNDDDDDDELEVVIDIESAGPSNTTRAVDLNEKNELNTIKRYITATKRLLNR